jgi:Flp pilus assembly protein TadG
MNRDRLSYDQEGSSTVEAVVLIPVLMIFVLLSVAFGRFEMTSVQVVGAARAAAESAAIMPSAPEAAVAARAEAMPALSGANRPCHSVLVTTNTSHFVPDGDVSVTVSCVVGLSDLGAPGVPGSTTVVETQTAPIDPYRQVS